MVGFNQTHDVKAIVYDKDMVCKMNKSVVLTTLDNKQVFVTILCFKVIIIFRIFCSKYRKEQYTCILYKLCSKEILFFPYSVRSTGKNNLSDNIFS